MEKYFFKCDLNPTEVNKACIMRQGNGKVWNQDLGVLSGALDLRAICPGSNVKSFQYLQNISHILKIIIQ